MKVTDSDVIQIGEKELIDAITGDLDWEAIEKIFKDKYNLGFQEDVEYKNGDIVVHNNQIAYKLNFDVKVTLSVLFDRKGECLTVSALSDEQVELEEEYLLPSESAVDTEFNKRIEADTEEQESSIVDSKIEINENVSEMASQIADMISDINQD